MSNLEKMVSQQLSDELAELFTKGFLDDSMVSAIVGVVRRHDTQQDPAEVERLRADLNEWKQRCQYNADTAHDVAQERDTLRAQMAEKEALAARLNKEADGLARKLAERDALLHEVSISPDWSLSVDLQVRISNALSASAEPSAPVERCKDKGQFLSMGCCPKCGKP